MTVLLAGTGRGNNGGGPFPPPPANGFLPPRFNSTWTGWDGSVWDLLRPQASGVLLQPGVRGLNTVNADRSTSTAPGLAGSRWRGSRVLEREVHWPIAVYASPGNADFIQVDRAFWRTMHPDRPGLWEVEQPDGQARSLTCRFVSDGDYSYDLDPHVSSWTSYGVTLVAEQPFWSGPPVELAWENRPDPTPPYPRPGQHDPYVLHLSNGRTLSSATVTNAGDVEAYPVWTLTGPFDTAAVGVDGRQVQLPFGLLKGESVVLDADPSQLVATRSDGLDLTALLGDADWSAVPPGESVPLSLEMVGAGTVALSLPQRYYRAW